VTRVCDRTRRQWIVLGSMYAGYGAMMVCRQMVTILSPAMLADPSLGLTKTNLGDFAAYGTIGALVGKLIWGPLGDRIGGRKTFLLGILLSAVLVAAFGLSPGVAAFTVCSFLLYGAKSAGWPGMAKLVEEWFHPQKYGRVWGILSTSSRASVVVGTLFFGWLLGRYPWRAVAFSATGTALLILALCWVTLGEKPEDPGFLEADAEASGDAEHDEESARALDNKLHHPLNGTSLPAALWAFANSGRCWLIVAMLMALTCMMAFLDFVPVYLMEVFGLTPSRAAMASSVFPIGSLTGLLAAVAFYDRFSKKGLRRVLTIALILSTACVVALQVLPRLGLGPDSNFAAALALILIFGAMISPAYYIPMSVFSIEFGGPHSATLICLIDAFGFAASASFGFVGGRLADGAGGWFSFMTMLVAVSITGTLTVWGFLHADYKASRPPNA